MTPLKFSEANKSFGPPEGLEESQVRTAPWVFHAKAESGSLDGIDICVVAYQPSQEEAARLSLGAPIFLTFVGGLPPHMVTLSFKEATTPS